MKKGEERVLKKIFESRLLVLAVIMVLLFGILFGRVFYLQIVRGAYYQDNFVMKIEKKLDTKAVRGNIYDCKGELLAYNVLSYNLAISDVGKYDSKKEKNKQLNEQLAKLITAIHKNGDTIVNDFSISYDTNTDSFSYKVEGKAKNRFLADVFGKKTYEELKTVKQKDGSMLNQAQAAAGEIMDYLFGEDLFGVDLTRYPKSTAYEIAVVRYAMNAFSFTRYNSVVIAKNVSPESVAYAHEHSDELTGVTVEEDTIRKYNYSEYFAPMIGYTGKISTDEYEKLKQTDASYTTNDFVGRIGLEQYYEKYLRGKNGSKTVLLDSLGRIIEVLTETPSKAGSNLYLSIDARLQEATYKLLEQEIAGILYDSIRVGTVATNDVYASLVENNIIDISLLADQNASELNQKVYALFLERKDNVILEIASQLSAEAPLPTKEMSEEMLDEFTYIIDNLKNRSILQTDKIDTTDQTYEKWANGEISPKEYLNYCIAKEWIDIQVLDIDEEYFDSAEIYQILCKWILELLQSERLFDKLIYRYMIKSDLLSTLDLSLILMEQGAIATNEEQAQALSDGTLSPQDFILEKIQNIELTPAQIGLEPCTGSTIITDVNTGEIKALVSYPGYDNNRLANSVDAAYYAKLIESTAKPLYNYATQERTAPGSTFKMVISTAGLAESVIDETTMINCNGIFEDVSNKPRCWMRWGHGEESLSNALRDSCNVYYYNIGYQLARSATGVYNDPLGIQKITEYASLYGLNEPTGLEITENASRLATRYPVMAAIGQSDNNISTAALSRYITAVSTGRLYQYQLMNRIEDAEGSTIEQYQPDYTDISSTLSQTGWNSIHTGMRMVCENLESYGTFPVTVAGKTGTAEQENHPNHALFVAYAPFYKPEISIATRISYGYSSHNAADVAKNILAYYFQTEDPAALIDGKAEKASGVSANND